jgi:hypothetical protein
MSGAQISTGIINMLSSGFFGRRECDPGASGSRGGSPGPLQGGQAANTSTTSPADRSKLTRPQLRESRRRRKELEPRCRGVGLDDATRYIRRSVAIVPKRFHRQRRGGGRRGGRVSNSARAKPIPPATSNAPRGLSCTVFVTASEPPRSVSAGFS